MILSWVKGWFEPPKLHDREYEFALERIAYHLVQLHSLCYPKSNILDVEQTVLGRTWFATVVAIVAASPDDMPLVAYVAGETMEIVFATARVAEDKRQALACRAIRFLVEGKEWRD